MAQQIIRSIGSDGLEVLSNILDQYTGELVTYKETLVNSDFAVITDADVDGVVYIKKYGKYFKRVCDKVNVLWYGAKGDDNFDNGLIFQKVVNICLRMNLIMYIPKGIYVVRTDTLGGSRAVIISNWTSENQGLHMLGDGKGITIIKEADGSTERGGRWTRMFYCYLGNNELEWKNRGRYIFEGITFDKNARNNQNLTELYGYEQSHIITFAGSGNSYFPEIVLKDIEFYDKIGAGFSLSSIHGFVEQVTVDNVYSLDHPNVTRSGNPESTNRFGQRACLEIGMYCNNITTTNSSILYAQAEPETLLPKQRNYNFINTRIDIFEYTDKNDYTQINATNLTCIDEFLVRGCKANIVNSNILVKAPINSWDLQISNSIIYVDYNRETLNIDKPFFLGWVPNTFGVHKMEISNSSILINDPDPDLLVTGFLVKGGSAGVTSNEMHRKFVNCRFDKRAQYGIDAYTNGRWDIVNCECASTSHFMKVGDWGAELQSFSDVRFIDNRVEGVQGKIFDLRSHKENYRLYIKGGYSQDKLFRKEGLILSDGKIIVDGSVGKAHSSGAYPTPESFIPKNTFVKNADPSISGIDGWIKESEGNTKANWRVLYQNRVASVSNKGVVNQAESLPTTATMEQLIAALKTAGLMAT